MDEGMIAPATVGQSVQPEGFRFVAASGGIEEYRLEANGLQVLLLPDATAPVVTFMVTYRVGSRNEGAGYTGATHFLEHLMFKGTERFNRRKGTSVFNVLQRVGAQVNATTWFDRTNYYAMLPAEHLELAVEIEADRMRGALLDPEDVEDERSVILNEFDRGENEPTRKLYHAVWSTAFLAHPYRHPTIGWRSDIERIGADGLRHFYDTFYWPGNATVSVIGDFEREEVLATIFRHFGAIPASASLPSQDVTREPEQRGERRVTVRMAGQLGALMAGWKAAEGLSAQADALDVLSVILGVGKRSRLYADLVDPGLATSVFCSAPRLRDPGLFTAFAFLAPGRSHREVEEVLLASIDRVGREGVSEEELERARSQLRAQEAYARDGSFAAAAHLNEAIAAGDWRLYPEYLERVRSVTADQVQEAARTCLVPDARTVGHYIPLQETNA